jgi:hypothetical protein
MLLTASEPTMTPFATASEDPFITNLPYLAVGIGIIILLSVTSVLVVDRRNKRNAEIEAKKKAKLG